MESIQQKPEEPKYKQFTSNKIQISTKKEARVYINASKSMLAQFPNIELHALGEAITICAKVGEILSRNGYTITTKIETSTLPASADIEKNSSGERKKAKLIIALDRAPTFADKIKEDQARTASYNKIE